MSDHQITAMPAGFTPVVPFEACFDAVYGLEVGHVDVAGEGVVRATVAVRDGLLSRYGLVHGGVFAAAAEALASRGTALSVIPDGFAAMGQSNDTTMHAPVGGGTLAFEARLLSRGADAWLWSVEATAEDGSLAAFSRVTVAVRPFRPHSTSS